MQSPLSGKPKRSMRRCQASAWTHSFEGRSLTARQQAALVGPGERQVGVGETGRGEVDEAPDIATSDAVALGQFPQRSSASGGKLLEPRAPAGDRLDQRGVASRSVIL